MAIPVSAPSDDNFVRILAPDGLQPAICCDVVEEGVKDTGWGPKERVSIHFLLAHDIPTDTWQHPKTGEEVKVPESIAGKPFKVSAYFNRTLGEKSTLRKFLRTWRGREFTLRELANFDLESVIGVPAALSVVYNNSDGKWYANIDSASRLPDGWDAPRIPNDYVRFKDRPPREGNGVEQRAQVDDQPEALVDEQAVAHVESDDIEYDSDSLPF